MTQGSEPTGDELEDRRMRENSFTLGAGTGLDAIACVFMVILTSFDEISYYWMKIGSSIVLRVFEMLYFRSLHECPCP